MIQYCAEFGITREELLLEPESSACSSYARYILDVGAQGDVLDLYVAIAACLIGYGEVGLWLQKQVKRGEAKMEGNVYKRWMEDYAGEDYLGAVNRGIGLSFPVPPPSLHFTSLNFTQHRLIRPSSILVRGGTTLSRFVASLYE